MARTVLLADDSVTAQNMGRRILTDAGYEVITVNNGSAALKKIHETRPDLIVLDVYMPGYGGLEVCQRLKESGDTMRIPVLLTVGKMEPFKAEEAKRVRADGHIVKPFEASELLAALTKLEDRIVPNDSGRGKKREKKPSFWHGTDEPQADWTDNVAYLSQAKQRKSDAPEPEAPEAFEEVAPRKRTSDAPVPASGELPVVADSVSETSPNATPTADVTESAYAGAADTTQHTVQENADEQPAHVPEAAMEKPNAAGVAAAPRWVAQNVALTAEEAALELDREMQASEAAQATAPSESSESESSWEVVEDAGGATFAAAAAAGASSASTVIATPTNENEVEPQPGSEAVVAWENWQHIRDAVMNSQATDGMVEKAAQVAQAVSHSADGNGSEPAPSQPAAADEAPSATDAAAEGENAALANIVDSVLAELKPKLMQEIAKKLKK